MMHEFSTEWVGGDTSQFELPLLGTDKSRGGFVKGNGNLNSALGVLLATLIAATPARAQSAAPLGPVPVWRLQLTERFAKEAKLADERFYFQDNAERLTYDLAFSQESAASPAEYVGNLVRALNVQAYQSAMLAVYHRKAKSAPWNGPINSVGLRWLPIDLGSGCRHCRTWAERKEYARAALAFRKVIDVQGVQGVFSGLPFYGLAIARLGDPAFLARARTLHGEVTEVLARMAAEPGRAAETNVFALATKACGGSVGDAVELVGLLLSRDSSVLSYFSHLPPQDPSTLREVAEIPLLVRLVAELDRVHRGSKIDQFSYDGRYSTSNIKNYYFWSGALAGKLLREQGFSEASILELTERLPHFYKRMRALNNSRNRFLGSQVVSDEFFRQDAIEVIRNSASGARMSVRVADRGCLGTGLRAAVRNLSKF